MSERTRNGKEFGQDGIGVLFCLVGGFFAVSIVLLLNGQESKSSVRLFTWPVVELVGLLGATAALLASVALAGLGSWLFLRPTPFSAMRPLVALLVAALGLTLGLGAFGIGGSLGGWLPGLVQGFAGRTLDAVLGLALVWLGWTLLPTLGAARTSASDALRMGLSSRGESAAGVSPAEAALLVTPRPPARREEPVTRPAPTREEPKRAVPAAKEAPAKRVETQPVRPLGAAAAPAVRPLASPPVAPPAPREEGPAVEDAIPPAPSWESSDDTLPLEAEAPFEEPTAETDEEEDEEELVAATDDADPFAAFDEAFDEDDLEADEPEEDEPSLAPTAADVRAVEPEAPVTSSAGIDASLSALAESFETDETPLESEEGEDLEIEEEISEPEPPTKAVPPAPLRAAWEQVGLFDEEEVEEEEEAEAAAPAARGDLTPTFDFDSEAPKRVLHEPEAGEEPPFPAAHAPKPVEAAPAPSAPVAKAPAPVAPPEPARDFLIQPAPAPAPKASPRASKPTAKPAPKEVAKAAKPPQREEPVVTPEEPGEGWNQLVYEAGCAILEQQRVAVSMLERRFGLDFDSACRVLDELQAAGLIGPYMGGRTRDILLTREEWLPHAPHAS